MSTDACSRRRSPFGVPIGAGAGAAPDRREEGPPVTGPAGARMGGRITVEPEIRNADGGRGVNT